MAVVPVYKKLGATPLEALEALRVDRPDLAHELMTYAGRLDPMAEGVLLVLTGEDRYRAKEFQQLDKTYRATFLLGFSSDTGDVLGMVGSEMGRMGTDEVDKGSKGSEGSLGSRRGTGDGCHFDRQVAGLEGDAQATEGSPHEGHFEERIREILVGNHEIPLPAYSSYKVKGKPLHYWAKSGRLAEIEIPRRVMRVHAVRNVSLSRISYADLFQEIASRIALVQGDFRQEEILLRWRDVLREEKHAVLVHCELDVSSGTYVRSLAKCIEENFHIPTLLFRLFRSRVG